MHQAQVTTWGQPPQYVEAPALPPPKDDEYRIKVSYAGLHRVVRSRAAGSHYSSGPLPHVPGIDGVGMTEDGRNVYFSSMSLGTMSEEINAPKRAVIELPEGLDPLKAAAMVNPAMSSWMAFKARTREGGLREGFSVLVLGATSASGRLAIPFAKTLGAGRVVGAARDAAAMEEIEGLDERLVVAERPEETNSSTLGEVDVVIDYIGGPLTTHLLDSITTPRPVDYVHIGSLSGDLDLTIPGAILRSKDIAIKGSGPGSWQMGPLLKELPAMLEALKYVPQQPVKVVKLSEVESEWVKESKERVVFTL